MAVFIFFPGKKMKTKKNFLLILIAFSIIAFLSGGIYFLFNKKADNRTNLKINMPASIISKKEAFIYFTENSNNYLKAEKQKVVFDTNARKYAQNLIRNLLDGPQSNNLISPVPEETKLIALYIQDDNTAVLDFSNEISKNHPRGSQAEILTIYSIVNTLTLNINEIEKVKILINGNEAETLAGHISLKFPLKENLAIIK